MTTEEKAKAYDEALKVAKGLYAKDAPDSLHLERMFPELVESEDERIRKVITDIVKAQPSDSLFNGTKEKCLAWLEKQGEKKPTDKVEPKFKVGNKIKLAIEPKYPAREIIAIQNDAYYFDELVYLPFSRQDEWELVEQKPAETEKGTKGNNGEIPNSDWSEEDEMFVHGLIRGLAAKRDIHGHTTFSSDCIDITKTINWLKSLKDRVQPQPKQEWSMYDETILKAIIDHFEYKKEFNEAEDYDIVLWLKSLRPQNRWKPSDEQMYNLSEAAHCDCVFFDMEILKGLYDELKKL